MKQITGRLASGLTLFALLGFMLPLTSAADVPFTGKGKGQITSFVPGPGGIAITAVAEGTATHLGHFTREESLLLDPATGAISGSIVFTAANGDQLTGIVSGGFVSQTDAAGTYTFTGGTGRFQDASGGAHFIVSTADGVNFSVKFKGRLSRD
jgi:hypothetical protein